MEGVTPKEKSAIFEFRERVADVLPNDPFLRRDDSLLRWIRARDLDLEKAENMFRNSMKWRKSRKVDLILSDTLDSELVQRFPYYLDGVDKRGRPVLTLPFGKWNIRSLIEEEGSVRFDLYVLQLLETISRTIKATTLEIENTTGTSEFTYTLLQVLTIIDMSGYSYWQLANIKAIEALIPTLSMYEAHYPEVLGQCIVINALAVFSILFKLTKPFMSARTIGKIKVFSSKKNKWNSAVADLVDKDQIRESFGGTKRG